MTQVNNKVFNLFIPAYDRGVEHWKDAEKAKYAKIPLYVWGAAEKCPVISWVAYIVDVVAKKFFELFFPKNQSDTKAEQNHHCYYQELLLQA